MLQSITENLCWIIILYFNHQSSAWSVGDQLIWKVDLNTTFLYIISTFKEGRRIRGIKKREEHQDMKDRGRTVKWVLIPEIPRPQSDAAVQLFFSQDKAFTALLGKLLQEQDLLFQIWNTHTNIYAYLCVHLTPVEISIPSVYLLHSRYWTHCLK